VKAGERLIKNGVPVITKGAALQKRSVFVWRGSSCAKSSPLIRQCLQLFRENEVKYFSSVNDSKRKYQLATLHSIRYSAEMKAEKMQQLLISLSYAVQRSKFNRIFSV